MKKTIAVLLTLGLMLSGCGAAQDEEPEISSAAAETTQAVETTQAAATEPFVPEETLDIFQKDASVEETVLYDDNGVKITLTGIEYNNWSADLQLLIENNAGKNLQITSETVGYSCNSVNGYMISDGYINCEVEDGKKANETMVFSYEKLQLFGIQELRSFQVGFDISDDDRNDIYTGPLDIHTSLYDEALEDSFLTAIETPAVLNHYGLKLDWITRDCSYEKDEIRMSGAALVTNGEQEQLLLLDLESQKDIPVQMVLSDLSFNGMAVSSGSYDRQTLNPEKHLVMAISLDDVMKPDVREAYGMTELGSVGFRLKQTNMEYVDLTNPNEVSLDLPGEDTLNPEGQELYHDHDIRVLYKSMVEDPSEYSGGIIVLLFVENHSSSTLEVEEEYDSLSVNGFMMDGSLQDCRIPGGKTGAAPILFRTSDLAEIEVTAPDQIESVELTLELTQSRDTVDSPTITIAP